MLTKVRIFKYLKGENENTTQKTSEFYFLHPPPIYVTERDIKLNNAASYTSWISRQKACYEISGQSIPE